MQIDISSPLSLIMRVAEGLQENHFPQVEGYDFEYKACNAIRMGIAPKIFLGANVLADVRWEKWAAAVASLCRWLMASPRAWKRL